MNALQEEQSQVAVGWSDDLAVPLAPVFLGSEAVNTQPVATLSVEYANTGVYAEADRPWEWRGADQYRGWAEGTAASRRSWSVSVAAEYTQSGAQLDQLGALLAAYRTLRELEPYRVQVADRAGVLVLLLQDRAAGRLAAYYAKAVRAEFGEGVGLLLEARVDAETSEPYLRMCVRAPSYDAEFVQRLRRVRDSDHGIRTTSVYLLLTSDFA